MKTILTATRIALLGTVLAGTAALAAGPGGGKPKAPPKPEEFYQQTGFEGREAELGAAVMEAVRKAGPKNGEGSDFTPAQVEMLGLAVGKAIKTISNNGVYQHEMNDALVKALLTNLQFAKDRGLLEEIIDHEVKTQTPMLVRVGRWIQEGGSEELGLIALTERTACFYQLVQHYERNGTTIRWKAPFGNVLAVTTRLGQHNLTEKEIHEVYTIPLMRKQAAVMGMEVDISPWREDGWVTMSIRRAAKVAAVN